MTDDLQIKRRLTAILSADAVSYSRMMSEDEEQTLRILADHRRIIDAIIQTHEGRIVNTAGDSVLAEFPSSVEAVRCAIEMQEALKTRNDALPEEHRMTFRVGVNLGDVMISGTDLLGDGVNVAARLQSIAEPGGICISSSVYDQISGKINLGFADLGELNLKNITRSIHVYKLAGANAPIKPRTAAVPGNHGMAWGVAGLAVVAASLVLAWYMFSTPRQEAIPAARVPMQAAPAELEQARLEAERVRTQAELEKARAEGQMVKMQAELELQKARTEAEQIKRRSEAEARGKAATTTRPESVVTAATPSVPPPMPMQEATGRPTEPPAKAAASLQWIATLHCEPFEGRAESRQRQTVTVRDGMFVFEKGEPGRPGYVFLQGKPADGQLTMVGNVISNSPATLGQQGGARLGGSFANGGYQLKGKLGRRPCSLTLESRQ